MPRFSHRIAILFIFLACTSCSNEYIRYHQNQEYSKVQQTSPMPADLTHIADIAMLAKITPDIGVLDDLIHRIQTAHSRVWIEVYMLSEKRIISALQEAKSRQVDVRVILEPNPYGNPYINRKTAENLKKSAIDFAWADDTRFTFTHAKFAIIDTSFLIGTANFTHSAFVTNREFLLYGSDPSTVQTLENLFTADFSHESFARSNENLVISPIDSRQKIESLLHLAHKSIRIYAETFDDEALFSLLEERVHAGISITCIIASPKKISANTETIRRLKAI